MRTVLTMAGLLALAACSGQAANVALGTALAGGASVANRRAGGCYAACPPGTSCVEETGYCEPCGGKCAQGERCERLGGEARCMRAEPLFPESPSAGGGP